MAEYMILGLRLTGGVNTEEFRERYGHSIRALYGDKLESLKKRGLLAIDGPCIRLTEAGLDLANQVFVEFI
jgi:oxygen-independent coproporphyrinogen-3 oxidase